MNNISNAKILFVQRFEVVNPNLDCAFGLDGGNSGIDVLGNDVTTVHHAAGHVLTVAGIFVKKIQKQICTI